MPGIDDLLKIQKRSTSSPPSETLGKGHGRFVLDLAKQKPTSLTLIIQRQTCANCGAVEEHSNRHLLASYPPPADRMKTVYAGKIIHRDIPLRTSIEEAPSKSDFCQKCWPPGGTPKNSE